MRYLCALFRENFLKKMGLTGFDRKVNWLVSMSGYGVITR
jgi:hypothetical protein